MSTSIQQVYSTSRIRTILPALADVTGSGQSLMDLTERLNKVLSLHSPNCGPQMNVHFECWSWSFARACRDQNTTQI